LDGVFEIENLRHGQGNHKYSAVSEGIYMQSIPQSATSYSALEVFSISDSYVSYLGLIVTAIH
jgi:hypothetical protein